MKKINARISLVTVLFLIIHVSFEACCYIFFLYRPLLSAITGYSLAACMAAHTVISLISVLFFHDSKKVTYIKPNLKILVQRICACAIVLLLPLHICSFSLLKSMSGKGPGSVLVYCLDILFYLAIFSHVSVSFSKALITLGILSDSEKMKRIDTVMYILCSVLFLGMSVLTTYTRCKLFNM